MGRDSHTARSLSPRAAFHALGMAIRIASLTLFVALGTASVHACPAGTKVDNQVNAQAPAAVVIATPPSAAPAVAPDLPAGTDSCCGNCTHSHGYDCVSGSCSLCFPAIDGATRGLPLHDGAIARAMREHVGGNSIKPTPNFRPPRT